MNFSHDEVLWILHNYQSLRQGDMPKRDIPPIGASYVFSFRAPFENACLLAGEIAIRVQRCGLDGLLCEERFGLKNGRPQSEKELARMRHLYVDDVYLRVNKVTWYITGRDIREQGYDEWKRENRYKRVLRPEVPLSLATTAACVS